ncbi:MAG: 30S ribosomal protein S17 [Christensenellaceae bacterium]|jgi:small subunit ribosomal protein S17|nr:30S ribosomal protein S17 [Christensenellaceae bacterium]
MADRNLRKERVGIVTSDKMDKTVVVTVEDKVMDPLYKKFVKQTRKFVAHNIEFTDGNGVAQTPAKIGDTVEITETRPLSKTKRWRVSAIVARAK